MKTETISILVDGKLTDAQLGIAETFEELLHMVGKDALREASLAYHYRVTLPHLRKSLSSKDINNALAAI